MMSSSLATTRKGDDGPFATGFQGSEPKRVAGVCAAFWFGVS